MAAGRLELDGYTRRTLAAHAVLWPHVAAMLRWPHLAMYLCVHVAALNLAVQVWLVRRELDR